MTDPDPRGHGWATIRSRRAWCTGGVKRRMVGVTSQFSRLAGIAVQRVRQKDGQGRAGSGAGEGQHKREQGAEFGNKEA
ncbi:unnamed protein product, partial [Staurois parvus]